MGQENSIYEQLLNNMPAIITGVTAIVSALVAFLGSYLVGRNQIKMKIKEIQGQSELKARELIYNNYQSKVQRLISYSDHVNKALSEWYAWISEVDEEKQKNEYLKTLNLVKKIVRLEFEDLEEIKDELVAQDMFTGRWKMKYEFIEQALKKITTGEIKMEDAETLYFRLWRAMNYLGNISKELSDKRSDDLFSVYLKKND